MKNSFSLRILAAFFVLLLGVKSTRAAVLTVGSGTVSSTVYPINSCWGYNYSQTIYYASDLIAAGATAGSPLTIANLQYNITTFVSPATWKDWVIYMANTTATNFSTTTSWLPVVGMTKVYDGTINPVSTGWYNITLATPFIWDGVSNVVIAIDENTPAFTCTAGWQNTNTTPTTTFRSIMYRSDATNPDPASPPTASARGASISNFRIFTPCVGAPTGGTAISSAGSLMCSGTSTTLSVTGGTAGSGIAYQWEVSTTSTGPWTGVAGATTDNLTIAPPSCNTQYYRLKTTCIASASSDFSSAVKVETSCALTPPYLETFESITAANTLPNCMSATGLGSLVTTYLAASTFNRSNHTPGGNKYAAFRFSSNDWIYTPPIMLTAGKTYEFSFWYIADGFTGWDTLKAAYGSLPVEGAMTTALGTPITAVSNTVYTKYKSSFVASASGVQYFGIKVKANGVPWYLSVDDISLQEVPDCAGLPSPGIASASPNRLCGSGVVELDLPGLPLATGYAYKWQDSTVGGTWGSDPGRPSFDGNKIPFKTGTIDKNTYFRCIVTCTITGETAVSSPVLVLAGPYEPPYFETFESITANNQLPTCMSSTGTLVETYTAPLATYFRTNHTPGGSKFASFRWGCNDYLFSPPMNLKAGYQYIISFWYITDGFTGWNTLGVKMGTDATAAGMTTSLKMLTTPINTTYQQYTDTIIAPATGTFYFGIYCNATSVPWYLSIDDIGVQFRPCNGKPDAGTITSTIPSGAGTCPKSLVTLNASGATPTFVQGIKYQWQRRDLSSPVSWNNVSGANSEILSSDTLGGYEYRFVVVCTNTGDSSFSPVFVLPQLNAHPPISISPSATPATFCLGDTVKFNATNFSGTTYDWMKDSVVIPGWKFSDIGITEAGTYMVKASSSVAPCPAYSNEVVLNVNDPGYAVSISTPADSIICEGKVITLFGTASKPGVTYQWSKNNSPIAGATGNSILINTTGYYQIRAFDGSSFCPALSRTVFIKVNPAPAAVIKVPGGTTACENDGVLLKAPSGLFAYEWSKNGLTVVGMTDSNQLVKAAGKYQVKVRSAEGCVSVSSTIDVTILPAPTPTISKSGLVLTTSSPYSGYIWVRNGTDTVSRTSTVNLTKKGLYKVYVEDANGCKGMSNPIEILDESLSLDEISATDNQIRLYPNPTNGNVTIESPVVINIEVKDMTGKTILMQKNSKMVDLSNYPDGIYLFIISDNDKLINQQRVTKISGR